MEDTCERHSHANSLDAEGRPVSNGRGGGEGRGWRCGNAEFDE